MHAQTAVLMAAGSGVQAEVEAFLPRVTREGESPDSDPLLAFPGATEYAAQIAAAHAAPMTPDPDAETD